MSDSKNCNLTTTKFPDSDQININFLDDIKSIMTTVGEMKFMMQTTVKLVKQIDKQFRAVNKINVGDNHTTAYFHDFWSWSPSASARFEVTGKCCNKSTQSSHPDHELNIIDVDSMSNILKLEIIEFIKSEGKKAFTASDYTQAINYYHKALNICDFIIPDDDEEDDIAHATLMATMCTNIGMCFFRLAQYEIALEMFSNALGHNND
jgi:tetratricopeptide (TPR) repeat protein|mmetsp:Transcript_43258/g.36257  ORF Transcript_43258/g.36257 Transcript_43258/m.36257 type:complete len:207 (+) Transcript_43258:2115-2735(+)